MQYQHQNCHSFTKTKEFNSLCFLDKMPLLGDHKILRILLIVLSQLAYIATLIVNALAGSGKGTYVYLFTDIFELYIHVVSLWLCRSIPSQHWKYIRQILDRDHSCRMDLLYMGNHIFLALPDECIYPDFLL